MAGTCPWGSKQKFRLQSQYIELNKKEFKDLAPDLAKKLLNTSVRTIQMEDSIEQEQKYVLFERINTGSVALNHQEIRNCVSRGSLNDFLNEYAEEPLMDKIYLSGERANSRMERQESLLYLLVLLNEPTRKTVTKTDLDRFMISNRNASPSEIKSMRTLIGDTFRKIVSVFGEGMFTPTPTQMDFRSLHATSRWLNEHSNLVFREGMSDKIRAAFLESKEDPAFSHPSRVEKAKCIYDFLDSVKVEGVQLDSKRAFPREMARQMYYSSLDKKCGLCNSEILSIEDVELDHVIPWSRGGQTTQANAQLSHAICNRKKGAAHV